MLLLLTGGCPGGRAALLVNCAAEKQHQAGKEMGRSYGGACLNSGCVHVWWDVREEMWEIARQCRNQLCVLQQAAAKTWSREKGRAATCAWGHSFWFPTLTLLVLLVEPDLALEWAPAPAPAEDSYFLSRYFLQVVILKGSKGISSLHVRLGLLVGLFWYEGCRSWAFSLEAVLFPVFSTSREERSLIICEFP